VAEEIVACCFCAEVRHQECAEIPSDECIALHGLPIGDYECRDVTCPADFPGGCLLVDQIPACQNLPSDACEGLDGEVLPEPCPGVPLCSVPD
jgi:hypothetical protein